MNSWEQYEESKDSNQAQRRPSKRQRSEENNKSLVFEQNGDELIVFANTVHHSKSR